MSQNLPLMRVERMINWPDITNKFHEGKKTTKITLANTRIYETVKKSSFVSIYLQGNEIILKSSS